MKRILPALLLAAIPATAQAHLVSSGLGDFYDGLLHPFTSLIQLLPLLALAIWAGGRSQAAARWGALLLPLCWAAGGLLGAGISQAGPWIALAAASGLALGLAGAANLALPTPAIVAASALAGLILGAAGSATDDAPGPSLTVGAACAACVILVVIAGQRTALRGPVTPIAARVAASWIAAASLLQLGWSFRQHAA